MNNLSSLQRLKTAAQVAAASLVLLVGSLGIAGLVVGSSWFWQLVSAVFGDGRARNGAGMPADLGLLMGVETQEQEANLEFVVAWAFVVSAGLAVIALVLIFRRFGLVRRHNAT